MAGVLTVVARIHPKAGRESEVESLLVKMAAAVRQHEPDCLVYRPHRSTGEPTIFYFYEQYRSDAAFEPARFAEALALAAPLAPTLCIFGHDADPLYLLSDEEE